MSSREHRLVCVRSDKTYLHRLGNSTATQKVAPSLCWLSSHLQRNQRERSGCQIKAEIVAAFGAVCEREAPCFRCLEADKELSGCQQLCEKKASVGDPINYTKGPPHVSRYIFTHWHISVNIASILHARSSCAVLLSGTDTICSRGKDKVYTDCDTDVKELIFFTDPICDIWLSDFLFLLAKTCRRLDKSAQGLDLLLIRYKWGLRRLPEMCPPPCSPGVREDTRLGN